MFVSFHENYFVLPETQKAADVNNLILCLHGSGGGGSILGEKNSTTLEAALNVYNATTGQEIRKCYPEGGGFFMNDVAVKDGKAYATDSFSNSIMVLDVAAAVDGVCDISAIELPSHLFLNSKEGFQASGMS